ncbi:hypothetical protein [Arthrobacter sp. 3Tela_A]|uniref:hypothetical protein n=1 Tax=Arthrobacter sp. 3Tela_A TaxID=3093743 RepID=UPI003BB4E1C5
MSHSSRFGYGFRPDRAARAPERISCGLVHIADIQVPCERSGGRTGALEILQ